MNARTRKALLILVPLLVAGGLIVGWTLTDSGSPTSSGSAATADVAESPSGPSGGSPGPASSETGTSSPEAPSSSAGSEAGRAQSGSAASSASPSSACSYDPGASLNVPAEKLVSFQDPKAGQTDAPVTVVEFFDPNCSHCQAFHPVMKQLIDRYGDRVEFVIKPFPIWPYSVNQVEAMILASREDKFYEMVDAQIARGARRGLSDQQLINIAREIGLDVEAFSKALEGDAVRSRAIYYHKQGEQFGIQSTPTVAINGQVVSGQSRTATCMSTLIERELQQVSAASG